MQTGHDYSFEDYAKYQDDILNGEIIMVYYENYTDLFISPDFIANHNNFKLNRPLIYGGFCFSDLGNWPQIMTNTAGASGYFGFDWSVRTNWNAWWNKKIIASLADTSESYVTTAFDWMNNDLFKNYWDNQDNKIVSIRYYGDSDLALQEEKISNLYNVCDITIQYVGYYNIQADSTFQSEDNYLKMSNTRISGNFSGTTFTGSFTSNGSDGPKEDQIELVFNSDFSMIMSVNWTKLYKSSLWGVVNEELNFSAINIPLDSNYHPYYFDVGYRILGEETCNSITMFSHEKVTEHSPDNWIHTLDHHDCDEHSMIQIRLDKE